MQLEYFGNMVYFQICPGNMSRGILPVNAGIMNNLEDSQRLPTTSFFYIEWSHVNNIIQNWWHIFVLSFLFLCC